jgi:hypothetical protein
MTPLVGYYILAVFFRMYALDLVLHPVMHCHFVYHSSSSHSLLFILWTTFSSVAKTAGIFIFSFLQHLKPSSLTIFILCHLFSFHFVSFFHLIIKLVEITQIINNRTKELKHVK